MVPIREGYSVLFVSAPALVAGLVKAHAEGRLEERLAFPLWTPRMNRNPSTNGGQF